jgi:hypothetical protein
LARDPDRYFLAIMQAVIDAGAQSGMSERSVVDVFAAMRCGLPTPTTENIALMLSEKPFQVYFNASDNETQLMLKGYLGEKPFKAYFNTAKYRLKGLVAQMKAPGAEWREKNVFRPYADDFRRKLRKIRNKDFSDVDRRWLAAMSVAWRICFSGDLGTKTHAEALTAVVGERGYFSRVMQPILYQMFVRKTSPSADLTDPLSMPEFIRLFIPTT